MGLEDLPAPEETLKLRVCCNHGRGVGGTGLWSLGADAQVPETKGRGISRAQASRSRG